MSGKIRRHANTRPVPYIFPHVFAANPGRPRLCCEAPLTLMEEKTPGLLFVLTKRFRSSTEGSPTTATRHCEIKGSSCSVNGGWGGPSCLNNLHIGGYTCTQASVIQRWCAEALLSLPLMMSRWCPSWRASLSRSLALLAVFPSANTIDIYD